MWKDADQNNAQHEVRVADITALPNKRQLTDSENHASSVSKTPPRAAASVGDASPPETDTITLLMSNATRINRREACRFRTADRLFGRDAVDDN